MQLQRYEHLHNLESVMKNFHTFETIRRKLIVLISNNLEKMGRDALRFASGPLH